MKRFINVASLTRLVSAGLGFAVAWVVAKTGFHVDQATAASISAVIATVAGAVAGEVVKEANALESAVESAVEPELIKLRQEVTAVIAVVERFEQNYARKV